VGLEASEKALEQMYMEGNLMVSDREGFQKTYDLTERVLPSSVDSRMPSIEEFAAHIVDQQLRCHGFASLKGLTYLRRNAQLRKAVKALVDESLAQQALEEVKLSSGELFLIPKGALESPATKLSKRLLILSPFDNSVIQRERLKALFQFEYQIECYVPAAKRQYGYFSLPLLYRDEFIGRMDCKAHRKVGDLEIKSLYLEKGDFADDLLVDALLDAIAQFRCFQKCDTVSLTNVYPKKLTQRLRKALKAVG